MLRIKTKRIASIALAVIVIAGATPSFAQTVISSGTPGTTGATALYLTQPSSITTSDPTATPAELATFLGKPDDEYTGIGGQFIMYDLGNYRLINGIGQDFNVYEVDFGVVEFASVDVLVSGDGLSFFNVEGTAATALDLAGDEMHSNASFRRSYDLTGAVAALGVSQFRYLRLDGAGSAALAGSNGFDPDSVGFANFINTAVVAGAVPEPASWALMILGFGVVGGAMRTRKHRAHVAA